MDKIKRKALLFFWALLLSLASVVVALVGLEMHEYLSMYYSLQEVYKYLDIAIRVMLAVCLWVVVVVLVSFLKGGKWKNLK